MKAIPFTFGETPAYENAAHEIKVLDDFALGIIYICRQLRLSDDGIRGIFEVLSGEQITVLPHVAHTFKDIHEPFTRKVAQVADKPENHEQLCRTIRKLYREYLDRITTENV